MRESLHLIGAGHVVRMSVKYRKPQVTRELVCTLFSLHSVSFNNMSHQEKFEDEGFVYELTVQPAANRKEDLHTFSQSGGYYCQWIITAKQDSLIREVAVTDDDCKVIVYTTVEAAVKGAREFLCL